MTGDTLNAVKLTFTNYNQTGDKKFGMAIPSTVMLVRKKFQDSFFKDNKLSDGVSSYLTSHTSSTNQYVFSNITKLVNACIAEKEEAKKLDEENKDMFAFMQEAIADKVKTVRLSKKLKTHPVCLSSDGSITIEMEKVLNAMPQNDGNKVKAEKALEINPNHPIFEKLKDLYANDKDKLKDYAKLLYDQALLIEGMSIDNPVEFANLVCELMTK